MAVEAVGERDTMRRGWDKESTLGQHMALLLVSLRSPALRRRQPEVPGGGPITPSLTVLREGVLGSLSEMPPRNIRAMMRDKMLLDLLVHPMPTKVS